LPEHEALINRLGFNNHGVEKLLRNVERASFRGVLGINIGKNFDTPNERAADDYLAGLEAVYDRATYVAVNISSPNTKNLRDLQSSEALDALLGTLMARRDGADLEEAEPEGRERIDVLAVLVEPRREPHGIGKVDAHDALRFARIGAGAQQCRCRAQHRKRFQGEVVGDFGIELEKGAAGQRIDQARRFHSPRIRPSMGRNWFL
jgi:hypothetical protein